MLLATMGSCARGSDSRDPTRFITQVSAGLQRYFQPSVPVTMLIISCLSLLMRIALIFRYFKIINNITL